MKASANKVFTTGACKNLARLLLPYCFLLTIFAPLLQAETFSIATPKDVYKDFLIFVDSRDVNTIKSYKGPGARRDVIEVVLMFQALILGGYQGDMEIVPFDGYKRTLQLLQSGQLGAYGPSAWDSAEARENKQLLLSEPLVLEGEFEAGLYTAKTNTAALGSTSSDDLKHLTSVSNRNWEKDWALLESMGLKHMHHTLHWVSMVKMVAAKRAGFVLAPFTHTDKLRIKIDKIELVPIPGLKVVLAGSRHWLRYDAAPQ